MSEAPSRAARNTLRPEIDVVILTWNDGELLNLAVQSALASDAVTVSVVVVDNGSEPPAIVPSDSRVRLLRNDHNRGVAEGRNQGVAAGSAPIVCLLDSDAELAPYSLARLLEPLADPSVGITVPVFEGQLAQASAGRAPTARVKLARALGRRSTYDQMPRVDGGSSWDVDFGIGACQVFRRTVFDAVGGLDATIFYGPEDVDFCLRAGKLGNRIVQVRDTDVRHPPRRAFRRPLTRQGARHALAIAGHLWRHRRIRTSVVDRHGRRRTSVVDRHA